MVWLQAGKRLHTGKAPRGPLRGGEQSRSAAGARLHLAAVTRDVAVRYKLGEEAAEAFARIVIDLLRLHDDGPSSSGSSSDQAD